MKKLNILWFFLILSSLGRVHAQGNLLITPIRVVFEGNRQKEDLNLCNIGKDTAEYLISFLHYQMQEDGSFKDTGSADSMKNCADKYLRIFPRRVTLPPRESQVVSLQLRRLPGMEPGEYRSHLYFRAEKNLKPLGLDELKKDTTKMSVSIIPVFGLSIPVIVRTGNLNMNITLTGVSLVAVDDSTYQLRVTMNRSGNKSAYGNLEVKYVPEQGGAVLIGQAKGIGVYTELEKRDYSMLIRVRNGKKLTSGKLVVRYVTPDDDGNKELASAEYQL